jgi:hypothetical protein
MPGSVRDRRRLVSWLSAHHCAATPIDSARRCRSARRRRGPGGQRHGDDGQRHQHLDQREAACACRGHGCTGRLRARRAAGRRCPPRRGEPVQAQQHALARRSGPRGPAPGRRGRRRPGPPRRRRASGWASCACGQADEAELVVGRFGAGRQRTGRPEARASARAVSSRADSRAASRSSRAALPSAGPGSPRRRQWRPAPPPPSVSISVKPPAACAQSLRYCQLPMSAFLPSPPA